MTIMSTPETPTNEGKNNPTVEFGEPISINEIREQAVPEPTRRVIDLAAFERAKASKPVVARFITSTLLILFVCQMAVFTIAYTLSVFIDRATADTVSRSTEAILDGVMAIMPVTTSFLGVAIGFYFREVKVDEEGQENQ